MGAEQRFHGWYFKCQGKTGSLALIPAAHGDSRSLQVITGADSFSVPMPPGPVSPAQPRAALGNSVFSETGLRLDVHAPGLSAEGALRFGAPTPLRYDIMGPFAHLPFMECRHRVFSMEHSVNGRVTLNGQEYRFHDGRGYIEGDRGRSFPGRYLWAHSFFDGGSLMLAAADIPLGPVTFPGVIAAVRLGGREYRLATYLGARLRHLAGREAVIRQGSMTLTAALTEAGARPLMAPAAGAMTRVIREHLCCAARFRLEKGGRVLLNISPKDASFEFEYPAPAE